MASYYANITFIDEQIGRILSVLEETGRADNTFIIFTSDYGDMMGDHGLFFKKYGFEGSMHVPLIMKWPGHIPANTKRKEVVSLLDVYPTVLEAAGMDYDSAERPGKSILGDISDDRFVISEIINPPSYLCHVRFVRWKYMFWQNGGFEALFDIENDPRELKDLSRKEEYAGVLSMLRGKAEKWIAEYGNQEGILDESGHLISYPFKAHEIPQASPYSRMPWDYRIPPVLQTKGSFSRHSGIARKTTGAIASEREKENERSKAYRRWEI